MAKEKRRKDPNSISVLLFDVIENTDLDKVSSKGWQAYKNALALLDQGSFTARERDAAFKKLLKTGWETTPDFHPKHWEKYLKEQKERVLMK